MSSRLAARLTLAGLFGYVGVFVLGVIVRVVGG